MASSRYFVVCACLLCCAIPASAGPRITSNVSLDRLNVNRQNLPASRYPSASVSVVTKPDERAMHENRFSHLRVLVPNRTCYQQFVNCSDPTHVNGFCIDVFEKALSLSVNISSSKVTYTCFDVSNKNYNDMIRHASNASYDVVVGDVTLVAERQTMMDFTQPYIDSGIMMLTLAKRQRPSKWMFIKPFTGTVWYTILGVFVVTGLVLWLLERDNHPEFQKGCPGHQIQSVCWFVGCSLIFMDRDSIRSPKAHCLMVAWVIFCFLLGSCYIGGLTAPITLSKLSPEIPDINTLVRGNYTIGCKGHSIVQSYLINNFNVQNYRFRLLNTQDDVINSLSNRSVAAVFDEAPYVNLLLSSLPPSDCFYEVVGSKLTTSGFGFAFFHGSNLTRPLSMAILSLSENGFLQEQKEKWKLTTYQCPSQLDSTQVTLVDSFILCAIIGGLFLTCLVIDYASNWYRSIENKSSNGLVDLRKSDMELSLVIS